jgi:hypothetical protein
VVHPCRSCARGRTQGAAEDGEVLRVDRDGAAVDPPEARDNAVAERALALHSEVRRVVLDEHVQLLERALVEEEVEPLARGHLPRGVLLLDALLAAALEGLLAELLEVVELVGGGHGREV